MSTKPSVVAQTIAQTLDLDALEAEALASATPFEQLKYLQGKQQTAALEEANRIARASRRDEENQLVECAERMRQADEAHIARGKLIVVEHVRCMTKIQLSECPGAPLVEAEFTAVVQRDAAGKRGKVQQLVDIDLSKAEAPIIADATEKFRGALEDAERAADESTKNEIHMRIHGRSAEGLQFRRWREVWQPLLRRVVGQCIEDLLAEGIVKIVIPSAKAAE